MRLDLLKMHKRKSQIQMMETIAVLIVFFILIILGFVFYSNMFKKNIGYDKEEIMQLNAIKVAQRASFLPELQCSFGNIIVDNCVNRLNLKALSKVINRNAVYYFDRFSFSKITVKEVYPGNGEWVLYDKPLDSYSSKSVLDIPISLFDTAENKNSFGVMHVEVFSK